MNAQSRYNFITSKGTVHNNTNTNVRHF